MSDATVIDVLRLPVVLLVQPLVDQIAHEGVLAAALAAIIVEQLRQVGVTGLRDQALRLPAGHHPPPFANGIEQLPHTSIEQVGKSAGFRHRVRAQRASDLASAAQQRDERSRHSATVGEAFPAAL